MKKNTLNSNTIAFLFQESVSTASAIHKLSLIKVFLFFGIHNTHF